MGRFSTIEDVMQSYHERFYAEKAKGVEGIIQFIFTGEHDGGEYFMWIHDGSLDVEEGHHPEPSVTVTAPAKAWIDVSNGETSPMGLLMQGKLKIKGSLATATKLQTLFKPGTEL